MPERDRRCAALRALDLADYKALRDAMLAAHPDAFTSDAADRVDQAGPDLPARAWAWTGRRAGISRWAPGTAARWSAR